MYAKKKGDGAFLATGIILGVGSLAASVLLIKDFVAVRRLENVYIKQIPCSLNNVAQINIR